MHMTLLALTALALALLSISASAGMGSEGTVTTCRRGGWIIRFFSGT